MASSVITLEATTDEIKPTGKLSFYSSANRPISVGEVVRSALERDLARDFWPAKRFTVGGDWRAIHSVIIESRHAPPVAGDDDDKDISTSRSKTLMIKFEPLAGQAREVNAILTVRISASAPSGAPVESWLSIDLTPGNLIDAAMKQIGDLQQGNKLKSNELPLSSNGGGHGADLYEGTGSGTALYCKSRESSWQPFRSDKVGYMLDIEIIGSDFHVATLKFCETRRSLSNETEIALNSYLSTSETNRS